MASHDDADKPRRNSALAGAKEAKNDEFYTQIEDIERELHHYRDHFDGKVVFLNCDDPESSAFWTYFEQNFKFLGLKKLIATHYTAPGSGNPPPSYKLVIERGQSLEGFPPVKTMLVGDGDFRSDECVELLKSADICVTNPPFSLFRAYVAQMMEHGKKFVILGTTNAVTTKAVWSHIQSGAMWLGSPGGEMNFKVPADSEPRDTRFWEDDDGQKWRSLGNACWFTNLDHARRHRNIPLSRKYADDPSQYPTYDNYKMISVSAVADIPDDFDGLMGVPITFIGKHNPEQFEIVGGTPVPETLPDEFKTPSPLKHGAAYVNGKKLYQRIFIRRVRAGADAS